MSRISTGLLNVHFMHSFSTKEALPEEAMLKEDWVMRVEVIWRGNNILGLVSVMKIMYCLEKVVIS